MRPAPGSANAATLELSATDHIRAGQEVIAIGSAAGAWPQIEPARLVGRNPGREREP